VLDARCTSHSTEGALHVAGTARQRGCNATRGGTASLDTLLNAVVDVDHVEILAVGVTSAVDVEGSVVGSGEVLTIAGGARDGRLGQVGRSVVDAETTGTTTVLRRVTGARREAVSEDTGCRLEGGGKRRTTVTLGGIFKTSVVETLTLAV
jgi:hypothetical protein